MPQKVQRFFHRADRPLSLGCVGCPQIGYCGGLYADQGLFGCESLCHQCDSAEACDFVCKKYPAKFFAHVKEIGGFDLNSLPRTAAQPFPEAPPVVPLIFHRYCRSSFLNAPAVAVKLSALYSHRSGKLKFESRADVARRFRFAEDAKLIVVGVDDDPTIENFWVKARAANLAQQLAAIAPDLITTPNFSLPADVTRVDNMHAMKRIGMCFVEFRQAGLPASLHLNARTDRDWERWMEFVSSRDEIVSVTVEWDTGARIRERGNWLFRKLQILGSSISRPIHLIMKGGDIYLPPLSELFASITFIDSTSFMKTIQRFRLENRPSARVKRSWRKVQTADKEPLDDLLQFNVDNSMALLQRTLRSKRTKAV
jgi:hypothetical protein